MVEGIEQFNDIRPYEPEEMKQAFNDLLNDRQFNLIMKGFAPWLPKFLRNGLLRLAFIGVKSPLDFQKRFMKPVVQYIIRKHTDGCTFDDAALETNHTSQFFASKANKFERPSGARLPVAFPLHGRGGAAHITNLTGGWTGGVRGGVTGGLRILKPPVHRGFRLSTGGVGTFFEIHGVIWAC